MQQHAPDIYAEFAEDSAALARSALPLAGGDGSVCDRQPRPEPACDASHPGRARARIEVRGELPAVDLDGPARDAEFDSLPPSPGSTLLS